MELNASQPDGVISAALSLKSTCRRAAEEDPISEAEAARDDRNGVVFTMENRLLDARVGTGLITKHADVVRTGRDLPEQAEQRNLAREHSLFPRR